MARVLVTGGAGYIGGVAVEALLERGDDVHVLDNFWRGQRALVPDGAEIHDVDLLDPRAVMSCLSRSRPEAVLHFAGATLVGESVREPSRYFGVNVVGAHHLVEAMRETGVTRLVFSSTAAVYGLPEQQPISEASPTDPINPYGVSKLMVEQMLPWHDDAWGLRYACPRYFNVAGATETVGEEHDPETHLIPTLLHTVLGRRDHFSLFGDDYPTPDGTAIRDYVHVRDLIDAHLLAVDHLLLPDAESIGAMNLGSKTGYSVREIIKAVERITDREVSVEVHPRRPGDPPVLIADSTKATETLSWRPNRSTLDEMIGSAWAWYTQDAKD